MGLAAAAAWGVALALFGLSLWLRRRRRRWRRARSRAPIAAPLRAASSGGLKPSEALIYVDNEGAARELAEDEKRYVDTDFSPFDGARPYIKPSYEARNGWGELGGYLMRSALPEGLPIAPAPAESAHPPTPESVAAELRALIEKHR